MFGELHIYLHVNPLSPLYASVPVSRLPDLVYETKKDLHALGIVSVILGHVGDGITSHIRLGIAV